ncbi:MAG: hypothetical protein WCL17_03845 [Actinomycetota bacterium]|jgi:hypothetical protein
MRIIKKTLKAFGMFWWNFLVGDTPELFLAVVAILSVVSIFQSGHSHVLMIVLPGLVLVALGASVSRAIRKR